MNGINIIIPAQEKNKYSEYGDLVSFGETTLLEWKISQTKLNQFFMGITRSKSLYMPLLPGIFQSIHRNTVLVLPNFTLHG